MSNWTNEMWHCYECNQASSGFDSHGLPYSGTVAWTSGLCTLRIDVAHINYICIWMRSTMRSKTCMCKYTWHIAPCSYGFRIINTARTCCLDIHRTNTNTRHAYDICRRTRRQFTAKDDVIELQPLPTTVTMTPQWRHWTGECSGFRFNSSDAFVGVSCRRCSPSALSGSVVARQLSACSSRPKWSSPSSTSCRPVQHHQRRTMDSMRNSSRGFIRTVQRHQRRKMNSARKPSSCSTVTRVPIASASSSVITNRYATERSRRRTTWRVGGQCLPPAGYRGRRTTHGIDGWTRKRNCVRVWLGKL